jgi:hypothetical protein
VAVLLSRKTQNEREIPDFDDDMGVHYRKFERRDDLA